MELPIRIAEAEGATLGFENVSSGNIGTSGEVERLLKRFPSPALQLIWDPGNAYAAGDARSALEGYEAVRERVVNVHIKDAAFVKGKRVWLPVGAGEVEYPPFLAALRGTDMKACCRWRRILDLEAAAAPKVPKRR